MKSSHILTYILLLLPFLAGCIDDSPVSINPHIDSFEISPIIGIVYSLNSEFPDNSENRVVEYGFYCSETMDMTNAQKIIGTKSGSTFSAIFTPQRFGCNYYFCSYISNGQMEICSDVKKLTIGNMESYVSFADNINISLNKNLSKATITISNSAANGITLKSGTISFGVNSNLSGCESLEFGDSPGKMTFSLTDIDSGDYIYYKISVSDIYGNIATSTIYSNIIIGGTMLSPANCHIVSSAGEYYFKAVKGNSNDSVGKIGSVDVLWESYGTSTSINKGDLIQSVALYDEYIQFETNAYKGNAVIAVKDPYGTILWSWHIWLTDQPEEQIYYNSAGIMMDRNLGATSATPGSVRALGLLYQWGRKDPFLGSSSISSNVVAKSTISWPSPVASTSSMGTIEYAISHPTTFITSNDNNNDWYYSTTISLDDTRWGENKTIYDPCPAGWKVPKGSYNGVWVTALGSSSDFDWKYANYGMDFSNKLGSAQSIWYPFAGYYGTNGYLYNVGAEGCCWGNNIRTTTSQKKAGAIICFYNYTDTDRDKLVSPAGWLGWCSTGYSVRCVKE